VTSAMLRTCPGEIRSHRVHGVGERGFLQRDAWYTSCYFKSQPAKARSERGADSMIVNVLGERVPLMVDQIFL